ncbi:hypothetical protein GCM10023093_29490 [Nemorincola caseinilytica]|uniref:DUF3828 domain-containing protein n=1 Tax=Nemorincola caseinilytica TaxID=2054315 RepID=A0ABP8NQF8_9BACT
MRSLKLLLLPVLLCACEDTAHESNEEKLKRFYTYYITENDRREPNEQFSRDTLMKYCTRGFLARSYDDTDIDYDPVISGQGYDTKWTRTLTVTKATQGREKEYRVSYQTDAQHNSHNIVVTMAKEDGEWKIDDVVDNKK